MIKRKILCLTILLSAFVLFLFSHAQSAEPDWNRLIEFRDKENPQDEITGNAGAINFEITPWKEGEKEKILNQLKEFYPKFPGLFARAAQFGPVIFYRCKIRGGSEGGDAAPFRRILIASLIEPEKWERETGKRNLLHELAHTADCGQRISNSKEFRAIVEPRIKKARELMKEKGVTWREAIRTSQDQFAREVGLASAYGVRDLAEALAEYVVAIYFYPKEFTPPKEVIAFLEKYFFAKPERPNEAVLTFAQGVALYEKKKYDEALACFDKALSIDPDFPQPMQMRGVILIDKKRYDEALNEYNRLIPKMSVYDINYAFYISYRGDLYMMKGEYDKAIADFDVYLERWPNNAYYHYCRGAAWYAKKDFDKALVDFNEALKYNPEYAVAYKDRGIVWVDKGQYDKAKADFDKLISLDPGLGYYMRGKLWMVVKDIDKAIFDFDEYIKVNPGLEYGYFLRGRAFQEKGDLDKAIADFSEAIKRKADYIDAYIQRGILLSNKKELDKAISDFSEVIKLNPRSTAGYFYRGMILRSRDPDKAIADFTEVIKMNPNFVSAYGNRAEMWFAKKEFDRSLEDINVAIKFTPNNPYPFLLRGMIWDREKEYLKAIADFSEAIRLAPELSDGYEKLAVLWATCSDASIRNGQKAVANAKKACELTEWKNPLYIAALAAGYAEAGDFQQAVKWQVKALEMALEEYKNGFKYQLELYKSNKPYHEKN